MNILTLQQISDSRIKAIWMKYFEWVKEWENERVSYGKGSLVPISYK